MINVSQLTKIYGTTLAVDHVSFDVAKGQIVGFLGPNGAGKSTTLRMLTCYLPPTSGGATVNGFDIFHQSEQVRENLGYLPENVPLYGEMRVEEYLDFRGRLRKMDRADRRKRCDYVIERCWLKDVQRKVIGHLSKGYRQRVGLADALLHNPPVLILDEPTVGLDPAQIRETRKLIKNLGGDHTVMLSTHILPEVEAVCDRAIVIASGRIVAQGSPEELRASRRMQARVLVECKGPAKDVETALSRVSGVGEVEILNGETDGKYITAAIRPKESYDVREEVARTVIQNGWPLREVRLEHATLEEFFVQVTAKQAEGKVCNSMSRAVTIAERELSSYFYSPIAYVAMFAFLLATGGLFWNDFQPGQPAAMRTIFEWMVWLLVIIIPLLCMGLLAQEWASGTIETMMTAPVNETDVVLGKFFGSLAFFMVLLTPTLIYVVMLRIYGRPDAGPIIAGYLGILLVGALFIAIGLFCSSLTRSQVVAAVATAAILFLVTILPWWAGTNPGLRDFWRKLFNQSVFARYTDFSKGIIATGNLVFFLAATAVFLFCTVKVLESRRWK